jgi:signal transduction histidine kinase
MDGMTEGMGGKILIVDDYPANVKLLERNLRASGYETVAAYDGEEALRKVAEERPDLILLDIMLPKIDGYEVCHRLRVDEATSVIPIIMITALKETEDRIRGLEAGADDFISKPFDRGELLARVKSLLQIKYYRSMLVEREKFHAVIQDLSHGIVITDGRWRVQTLSRRAAELLGVDEAGAVGRDLADLLAPFQVEPSLDALRRSVVRSVTVELRQDDQRPPRCLAGRYTRIEGARGELHNAALVFRDISETRRKEQIKRDVLTTVGHKLKHPLSVIKGYLELAAGGHCGEVSSGLAKPLRMAVGNVRELEGLVDKMIVYAGLTATEFERAGQLVSISALVQAIYDRLIQRYPDRQCRVSVHLPPNLPRARAAEELLHVVLDDLMDNAVKFSDKDQIEMAVSAHEIADRQLEIAVRDNGPGIRPQERERIFKEFSQLEETYTGNVAGMGLGLSTAKRLVHSWGGLIGFESTIGTGSCFHFTVPSEFTPAREVSDQNR